MNPDSSLAARGPLQPVGAIALGAAVALAVLVVYLAGAPLHTDDLWFHLRMGEHFVTEGLRSGWDPILHTAREGDPVAHEWLFGAAVHGVDRLGGFAALRAVHAAAAAAIALLAASLLRREAGSRAALGAGLALFLATSWWRLVQLRPDLLTILLALVVFRLLLERGTVPSWRRVAVACALFALWANAHSAFVLGPLLVAAGVLGHLLRGGVLAFGAGDRAGARDEWAVARRLAAALGLGFLATLANPRGIEQHLTFFAMRAASVLPASDDWLPFHPFRFVEHGGAGGVVEWILTDVVLALFAACALFAGLALLRRPSRASLEVAEPVRFGLGLAAVLAMLVAGRFVWLSLFAILFCLRVHRLAGSGRLLRARLLERVLAAGAVVVTLGFFTGARYARFVDTDPRVWLGHQLAPGKYSQLGEGLRFLAETGVEGNLFNSYSAGAFLGYWLAPRVQAFIDGRNEAYPPEVFRDYSLVTLQRGARPGETFLDVLDRRHVDFFFGTGHPFGQTRGGLRPYTTSHVEGVPGWLPVFRSVGQSIHLRQVPRNRANLDRITAYYARERVPFDRERGFDVDAVIRERPGWAEAHQILPVGFAALREAAERGPARRRAAALEQMALYLTLAGAWEHEARVEAELLDRVPNAIPARRRRVHALLRLGRLDEALAEARELERRAPRDRESRRFVRAARQLARAGADDGARAARVLAALPLVDRATAAALLTGHYRRTDLDAASLRAAVAASADGSGA